MITEGSKQKGKNMKKILVTGGCGFIGTNFIKFIRQTCPSWRIWNLDALTYAGNIHNHSDLANDNRHSFVHGDISDSQLVDDLFRTHAFDAVFHFAAESHVDRSIHDPSAFITTNVWGTFQLLKASLCQYEKTGNDAFRFIHVSTDEVYGSLEFDDPAFTETTPYDPSSPYSASKAASDHLVKAYARTYGLPCIVTNCSNNYGPYQFPEKLIPLTLLNVMNNKAIPVYGNGKNVRDWLYVLDHCEALYQVFLKGIPGQTYNIGGGVEKQNIDIVRHICQIMDRKLNRSFPATELITFVKDRKGHDLRYAIDPGKTRTQIGWTARHSFEQALESTIDWYLENMEWVNAILTKEYLNWIHTQYD
jgi:dTDP-glucose 4,6-dehydratase